jgi:hypothetical protein
MSTQTLLDMLELPQRNRTAVWRSSWQRSGGRLCGCAIGQGADKESKYAAMFARGAAPRANLTGPIGNQRMSFC